MSINDIERAELFEEQELLSNELDAVNDELYLVERLRAQYRTFALESEGSGLSDDMDIRLGY